MPERRDSLVLAGLALLGAGGYMLLRSSSPAVAATSPPPPSTPTPPFVVDPGLLNGGISGGRTPATSAPSAPASPIPAIAAVQAIVAKIQASGPFYSVYEFGTSKLLFTSTVLVDAIAWAKMHASCSSVIRTSAGGGIVFTKDCGIATRVFYQPPPPPPPFTPAYRPPTPAGPNLPRRGGPVFYQPPPPPPPPFTPAYRPPTPAGPNLPRRGGPVFQA